MPAKRGRRRATPSPTRSFAPRRIRFPTRPRSSTSSSANCRARSTGGTATPAKRSSRASWRRSTAASRPCCSPRECRRLSRCCWPSSARATRWCCLTNVITAAASSCAKHLARFGVVTREVPACDYQAMEAAITPRTKLLVSESPTNPHTSIVDLDRFAALGASRGIETLIDATVATPYNLQPIAAGIDYVLHSATKYLGGHNDLLAGVIVGRQEKLEPGAASCAASSAVSIRRTTSTCWNVGSRRSSCGCTGTTRMAWRWPDSWMRIRGSSACTTRAWNRIRTTNWPSARCAALVGW